jgi:hypothetical protein
MAKTPRPKGRHIGFAAVEASAAKSGARNPAAVAAAAGRKKYGKAGMAALAAAGRKKAAVKGKSTKRK